MSKKDIEKIRGLIENAEKSIDEAKSVFKSLIGEDTEPPKPARVPAGLSSSAADGNKVIEGVFDGQSMIDDTGKLYPVPANYASKSKLVEGDRLKLTVSNDGSFVFKQIGPVNRRRIIAKIRQDASARGYVLESEGKAYKVLLASVTYFKVEEGDSVVALVPKDKESSWAAIENALQGGGDSGGMGINSGFIPQISSSVFPEENTAVQKPLDDQDIDEIIGKTIAEMEKEEESVSSAKKKRGKGANTNGFEW